MKFRFCIILYALINFFITNSNAQNLSIDSCMFTLSGKVLDKKNQSVLIGATVSIPELQKGSSVDAEGIFLIKGLCAGNYILHVYYIGYEKRLIEISLVGDKFVSIYLDQSVKFLKDAVVRTERLSEKTTMNKIELKGIDLEKTRGRSLSDALKEIPGVTTLATGPTISKPVIQGMHSNRILIINNGIRQEGQQWGSEHAPEIDAFIANKLTVIKGSGSIRYGSDAIGGVILVEPNPLRDSTGIGGEINLVGISNGRQGVVSGILEGNIKKLKGLSWRVQGTLKRAGNVKTPTYFLKNTGFDEKNFSWSVGYKRANTGIELFYSQFNTDIGVFTGSHIGNLTDLENAFNADRPNIESNFSYKIDRPFQHVEHELFKVKTYWYVSEKSKLNLTLARQYNLRDEYDKDKPLNDSLAALNRPELHYEITTHTGELSYDHEWFNGLKGNIGVTGMNQKNTYQGRVFIPNFENHSYALFLIERYERKNMEYEFGTRYDYEWFKIYKFTSTGIYSPERSFKNISFNTGFVYKFIKGYSFRLNVGTAFRAPSINELFGNGLHHGEGRVLVANEKLNPETAYAAVGGFTISDEKRLYGQIDFYYRIIDGYIYLQPQLPASLTIRGAFPTFSYTQTDANFIGGDVWLKYRLNKKWETFHKLNIVRAFNTSLNEFIPFIPSDRTENGIAYKIADQKMFENTQLTLSALNVAKQTRVQQDADYKAPPKAYVVLNFDLSTTLNIAHQHLELGFSINNLLNERFREYMNAFRYFTDEPGRSLVIRMKYHF